MFYYPNVLHRHTGCFSTIWLAATRGIRISRRELLKVNINGTCTNILDYVTAQILPLQPNLPKPRFSLYLSSQLQYGVVVVYHQQCSFLLEEAQQTIDRLLRSATCIRIDMPESDRLALDVPNTLNMMEESEGAHDPFFGVLHLYQLPSPYKIPQHMVVTEEAGSSPFLMPSQQNPSDENGFKSPPAAITLTEKEDSLILIAERFEGDDLSVATTREIDLLLGQPDQFRKDTEEPSSGFGAVMTSIDQLTETVLGAEQDSVWQYDKESGQPMEVPLTALDLEMTPVQVPMPTPPTAESEQERTGTTYDTSQCQEVLHLRKPGASRRRQLIFADPEVQISDRAMKEQISNTLAETVATTKVMLDLPSLTKLATPSQLFTKPCGSLTHTDLQSLWKQSAMLCHAEESKRESVQDREILRVEGKRRQSSVQDVSGSKGIQLSSESGLQLTEGSSALDVYQDMPKEDRSVCDVIAHVSRWSPQEEAQLQMEPIIEENVEMPEAQTDTESRDMLSWISATQQRFGKVTFDSLVAPETSRTTAAQTLYKLLELLSAGEVTAQQTEPYKNITINPATLLIDA